MHLAATRPSSSVLLPRFLRGLFPPCCICLEFQQGIKQNGENGNVCLIFEYFPLLIKKNHYKITVHNKKNRNR